MNEGYIKLFRIIKENKYFYKPNYLAVWIEILLGVNHEEKDRFFRGDKIHLQKGEGIFFQKEIADKFNMSIGTVNNILRTLKTETQIEIKTTNKYSIIKVINWNKYQQSETETETKMKPKGNQNETPKEGIRMNKNDNNIISKDINNSKELIVDKRILEIDIILETIKNKHGTIDGTIKEQRQYGKLLKDKLEKIKGFNGDYGGFITYLIENTDEYSIGQTTSPKSIYYNLGKLIAKIKTKIKKEPVNYTIVGNDF